MKFIRFVFYDFLSSIRSRAGIISMVIFPIAFMTILGIALKNAFNSTINLDDTKVVYVDKSNDKSKAIFNIFKDESKSYKVDLEEVQDIEKGKEQVKLYNDKILLELKGDDIVVYENNLKSLQVDYVVGIIKTISQRYSVYSEIYRVSPEGIKLIDNDFSKDYTKVNNIDLGRTMGSFDYYGIVEITMMLLYGSMFTLYSFVYARRQERFNRILQTGNSRIFYAFGIIVSKFLLVIITILPSIFYSKYVLKTYWGTDYLSIAIILLSLTFMAVCLGACVGEVFQDEKISSVVLNSAVLPVITFLGGGYGYIGEDINKTLDIATKISPLRWGNRAIINIIYSGNYEKMPISIAFNMVLASVFLVILFVLLKRREA